MPPVVRLTGLGIRHFLLPLQIVGNEFVQRRVEQTHGYRVDNLEQHRAIIDALLRENEDAVQDAIILHINHSLIKSLKMMENDN